MVLRIFVQGCSPHSNRCLEPEKGRLFRGWTKRYPPGRPRSSCVKELCLDGDSSILSSTGDDVKIGAKLASVWLQSQSSRIGPRLCRSLLVGLSCWVEQLALLGHLSYRLVSHIVGGGL